MYIPGLNTIFKLQALTAEYILVSAALAFAIIPVVELQKLIHRRLAARK